MELKKTDLVSLFERALSGAPDDQLEQVGMVVQVGDGMCVIHGLSRVIFNELVEFDGGNRGIVMQLDQDAVHVFLLFSTITVSEGEMVRRTNEVFSVPVSAKLLGRVVNALAIPIDGLGAITDTVNKPIEAEIPSIIDRSPVSESLETGVMAIDALVPIGKGQRELIIGNRGTGKTSLAIDTILHQKDKNVVCVYVAIGQRQANIARMVNLLEMHGALSYTVVVTAQASEAVLNQYVAPYTGVTIAEYFCSLGRDVLIVYDDLSNHAIAFREMSLLLRRAPGREAFPGDVFYLHSRLLERAGKLAVGGSITALPIVQIQSDDITAYIPTNLISITDGQVFLDTKLFNQGVQPAVNAELSVSRVGGAAQTKAIKKMTKALRLELAQYHELLDFAQFGTELDEHSKRRLDRGARIVELLKQAEHETFNFVDQSLMLLLLRHGVLDALAISVVGTFAREFVSYVRSVYHAVYEDIMVTSDISDATYERLVSIADEFSKLYIEQR